MMPHNPLEECIPKIVTEPVAKSNSEYHELEKSRETKNGGGHFKNNDDFLQGDEMRRDTQVIMFRLVHV